MNWLPLPPHCRPPARTAAAPLRLPPCRRRRRHHRRRRRRSIPGSTADLSHRRQHLRAAREMGGKRGSTYISSPAGSVRSESSRRPLPPWSEPPVVAAPVLSALGYHIRLWMQAARRRDSPTAASRQLPHTPMCWKRAGRLWKLPLKSSASPRPPLHRGDGGRSFSGDFICLCSVVNYATLV